MKSLLECKAPRAKQPTASSYTGTRMSAGMNGNCWALPSVHDNKMKQNELKQQHANAEKHVLNRKDSSKRRWKLLMETEGGSG